LRLPCCELVGTGRSPLDRRRRGDNQRLSCSVGCSSLSDARRSRSDLPTGSMRAESGHRKRYRLSVVKVTVG
jgi:hypothetical protein